MSSSLRDYEDSQHIADTLLFDRDQANGKTILYVEGDDDEFVYRQFICSGRCEIVVQNGDNRLENAIKLHNQANRKGYLAIKDNHFDALLKRTLPKNILTTDGYDLEVMILSSKAFEKVINVRLRGEVRHERLTTFESVIRNRLFRLGSIIGYFRLKSYCKRWNVQIEAGRFLRQLTAECELSFTDAMNVFTRSFPEIDISHLDEREFETLYASHQQHLCRGHDMVIILGKIFKRMTKKYLQKEYNPGSDLDDRLMLAFNESHFCKTQLYKKLRAWDSNNRLHQILRTGLCPSIS